MEIKKKIIFKQIYLTHINEILTGTTTLSQSGPRSNSNEVVLQTPQVLKTGISLPDVV